MLYNISVIYVVDYGAGNIMSVMNSFRYLSVAARLTSEPDDILSASGVVVPGVGHFGAAMAALSGRRLDGAIREAAARGVPVLGICLGLQLFLDASEESPGTRGLGLIPGEVTRLRCGDRKLPHIGWTSLDCASGTLGGMENEYFYFVHSFGAHTDGNYSAGQASYGETFDAAVEKDNVFATQFHPEKSGRAGLEVLRRFAVKTGGEERS